MAIFGIDDMPGMPLRAIKAATDMLGAADAMKPQMKTMYRKEFEIGIGLHCGPALSQPGPEERATLLKRLDEIEKTIITAKTPGSVADQLYVLREHITWARTRLAAGATAPP